MHGGGAGMLCPHRDHVEWDEEHVQQAEQLVAANSSQHLAADQCSQLCTVTIREHSDHILCRREV